MKSKRRLLKTTHRLHQLAWVLATSWPLSALADGDPKSATTSFAKELFTWGQGLAIIWGAWRIIVAGMAFADEEQAQSAPKKLKRAVVAVIIACVAVGIVQLLKAKFGVQAF